MRTFLIIIGLFLFIGNSFAQSYEELIEKSYDFVDKGDLVSAEESLKAAMRKEPANPLNYALLTNLGTIQRRQGKLEEALIVWLIETERLTSKERMYEVYLNIAEWGPLVYGIQEASAYYFGKRPSQLTTEESIFLASIIPKPKHFRSSFAENGRLKENMEGYYKLIAGRLAKKGLISEIEADSIRPDIQVTGDARNSLAGEKPKSSSPTAEEQ